MEFGFEPSSSRFEQLQPARTWSQTGSQLVSAKFHYAILVTHRSEAGRRPVSDLLARASSLLAR